MAKKVVKPEIEALIQSDTEKNIRRVINLAENSKVESVKLRACEVLLDRQLGKVPQAVTNDDDSSPFLIKVIQ